MYFFFFTVRKKLSPPVVKVSVQLHSMKDFELCKMLLVAVDSITNQDIGVWGFIVFFFCVFFVVVVFFNLFLFVC